MENKENQNPVAAEQPQFTNVSLPGNPNINQQLPNLGSPLPDTINPTPVPPSPIPSMPQVMVQGKGSNKMAFIILAGLFIVVIGGILVYFLLLRPKKSEETARVIPQIPRRVTTTTMELSPTITPVPTQTLEQMVNGLNTDSANISADPDLNQINTDLQQL